MLIRMPGIVELPRTRAAAHFTSRVLLPLVDPVPSSVRTLKDKALHHARWRTRQRIDGLTRFVPAGFAFGYSAPSVTRAKQIANATKTYNKRSFVVCPGRTTNSRSLCVFISGSCSILCYS